MINITPSWSYDRNKIVFARHHSVTGRERGLYVINADGSGDTCRTDSDGRGYDYRPVFSPDGSRIADYITNNSIEQIIIKDSDSSGPAPVTDGRFAANALDWSPNGSKIVYASRPNVEQNGRYEIFVMKSDGSTQTRLTFNPNADDGAPTWSPDGSKLMFVEQPDSSISLEFYPINLDGSGLRRMTTTTNLLEDSPHWRPWILLRSLENRWYDSVKSQPYIANVNY